MNHDDMIKSAKSSPLRAGKNNLIKHLEGHRITRNQAISAKCYDCNGMGELNSCVITSCALWPYSPYRQNPTAS